jgi:segregation and condensation protein B
MQTDKLKKILEAILISAEKPLSVEKLLGFFEPEDLVNRNDVKSSLSQLQESFENNGFELVETSSGFRFQTKEDYKKWVTQHWDEKPAKYSRALLETLALIIYRQPITRAEIEDVRGVAVSSHIVKTLQERDWIRIVGHKEVPGRPALLGTTRQFLDYFNLKSLDEMPSLSEIQDIEKLYPELELKIKEDIEEDDIADKLDIQMDSDEKDDDQQEGIE